jgi:hypothetical protein
MNRAPSISGIFAGWINTNESRKIGLEGFKDIYTPTSCGGNLFFLDELTYEFT